MLSVLKEQFQWNRSFEHQNHMLKYGEENIYNFYQNLFVYLNMR